VLLFLSAIGASTIVSYLLPRGESGQVSSPLPTLLAGIVLVVILVIVIFFRVMRRVGFPLGDLVAAADRVATGDYATRVAERGPPSLRSVARAFNSMTGRLEAQEQQRRHLMADIAHELRTPLAIIQGRLEGLLDGVYPRDDERLNELLTDTRVLARLVNDVGTLANAESGSLILQKEPTDLSVVIHEVVHSFAGEARAAAVRLEVGSTSDLPLVELDPLRIREVLSNLVSNAIRHAGGGAVRIEADATAGHIVLRVTDTGTGISADELPKIFDRFYKGVGSRGSGLGLTIAKNLVVAHGGEIRADSRPGEGTTISFTLPVA